MPTVTFGAGVPSTPRALFSSIDGMTGGAIITAVDSTHVEFTLGTRTFTLFGNIVVSTPAPGTFLISGGTLTRMESENNGVLQMTVAGLNISAPVLVQAINDDNSTNPAALENLFMPLGYTYTGNNAADILLSTDRSSDGVLINLSGNDRFNTGGGNDRIFLGNGNDQAHGGTGQDTFEGGNGNDSLWGDAGNDRLLGGAGNDSLLGGANNDQLFGDAGSDRILGGTGRDTLAGGLQADTFIFALHDGVDRILDFKPGDRIDLPTGTPRSFTPSGANDVILHYGTFGDQITLVGVDMAHIGSVVII